MDWMGRKEKNNFPSFFFNTKYGTRPSRPSPIPFFLSLISTNRVGEERKGRLAFTQMQ